MGWVIQCSNLARDKIFSSPNRPDRLWGPPSLLLNGYRGSFLELRGWGVALATHPTSSTEVKEKVQLHLYSLYMFSWYVTGGTFWEIVSLVLSTI